MTTEPIYITGAGCRAPNGSSFPEYFQNSVAGRSGIRRIDLFDPSELSTQIAGQVPDFDPEQWVDPSELRHLSRSVPMSLAATHEARRRAELQAWSDEKRTAVVLGSGGGPRDFEETQYRWYYTGEGRPSVYNISSSTIGNLASELSIRVGARGPSHLVSTGCTSSSDALGYALMLIRSGHADCVLYGGVDTPITPCVMTGFGKMRVIATGWNDQPARASRPFDADRNGFVLGEGAWMYVLESETHLKHRGGPRPLARVRAYSSSCDAHHRVRMNEDGTDARRTILQALERMDARPRRIDYVQLHGTSTELNDRIESRILHRTFENPPPASSVKSMIGHPQGASGAAGLGVTLGTLMTNLIHPTVNQETPDPECEIDCVPNRARFHRTRLALVQCLGFGSRNSMILVSPP